MPAQLLKEFLKRDTSFQHPDYRAATSTVKVAVIEECVFDRIEMSHKASLFDLQFKYCDVISIDRAYQQLATVHQGRSAATVGG